MLSIRNRAIRGRKRKHTLAAVYTAVLVSTVPLLYDTMLYYQVKLVPQEEILAGISRYEHCCMQYGTLYSYSYSRYEYSCAGLRVPSTGTGTRYSRTAYEYSYSIWYLVGANDVRVWPIQISRKTDKPRKHSIYICTEKGREPQQQLDSNVADRERKENRPSLAACVLGALLRKMPPPHMITAGTTYTNMPLPKK